MKKELVWLFGSDVNFMGYRKTGSYGMYCRQIRHHFFGIYKVIGFRYTKSWGGGW